MGSINLGQNLSTTISAAQNAFTTIPNVVNTTLNLKSALSTAYNSGDVGSLIRSGSIPAGAEAVGDILSAVAAFGGDAAANDWRVRLSIPNWSSFKTSPVLAPLQQAGGLIFPYTPQIGIQSSAKYNAISATHTNYNFQAYQYSDPGSIHIDAPMYVEDATQALYWIAMVHYLRSMTKMFTGSDAKAGNPPPVVYLNGYGNYVFKNVPVVITRMSVSLESTSDYIGCNVVGSMASEIASIADQFGGLANTIGGVVNGISGITSNVSTLANGVGQVAGALGTFGLGGNISGTAHVPTKSSFSIDLQPVYSRDSVRRFSLDRFVTGGYMNSSVGFI